MSHSPNLPVPTGAQGCLQQSLQPPFTRSQSVPVSPSPCFLLYNLMWFSLWLLGSWCACSVVSLASLFWSLPPLFHCVLRWTSSRTHPTCHGLLPPHVRFWSQAGLRVLWGADIVTTHTTLWAPVSVFVTAGWSWPHYRVVTGTKQRRGICSSARSS